MGLLLRAHLPPVRAKRPSLKLQEGNSRGAPRRPAAINGNAVPPDAAAANPADADAALRTEQPVECGVCVQGSGH